MIALALGFGSSLCWGVADFLGGFQTKRIPALVVVAFGQLGALVVLTVLLALTGRGLPAAVLPFAALAGVGLSVGLAAFYRALAVGTMGVVAPIAASGTTLPVVVGVLSGERPRALQALGLAVALVGVVLAVRSRPPDGAPRGAGSGLAVVAALALGGSIVFVERAAEEGVLATLLVSRCTGVLTLAVALAATGTALRVPRAQLPALLAIGLLDVTATGLFALASTRGLLSVVAVASSLYPAVTVLLARLALHERLSATQTAGVVAVLAGVCLMAAAQG